MGFRLTGSLSSASQMKLPKIVVFFRTKKILLLQFTIQPNTSTLALLESPSLLTISMLR